MRPSCLGASGRQNGEAGVITDKYIFVQLRKEQFDDWGDGGWSRQGILCQVDFPSKYSLAEKSVLSEKQK